MHQNQLVVLCYAGDYEILGTSDVGCILGKGLVSCQEGSVQSQCKHTLDLLYQLICPLDT